MQQPRAPAAQQPGREAGRQPPLTTQSPVQQPRAPAAQQPGREAGRRPESVTNQGGRSPRPNPQVAQQPRQQPAPFTPPRGSNSASTRDGNTRYTQQDRSWEVDQGGRVNHFSKPGMDANFARDGRLTSARSTRPDRTQIEVQRSAHGNRRVEELRPDRSRVVGFSRDRGFVEHAIPSRPGYFARTNVVDGRYNVSVYREQHYRGFVYNRYLAPRYYAPVFYTWAYRPWVFPVVFAWGWYDDPWFGYYDFYFRPAPVYPTAALWLTDYLLAENLRLAYETQPYWPPTPPPPDMAYGAITPEIREAIATEVRRQLDAERFEANSTIPPGASAYEATPPALDPQQRLFVVSMNADVTAGGQPCALTPGDVIMRTGDALLPGNLVAITVLTSKTGDCPANQTAAIDVALLQEMHNQLREQIDAGLQHLADHQGQDGLPMGPAPNPRPSPEAQAAPDPNAATELLKQQEEADRVEQDAVDEIGIPTGG